MSYNCESATVTMVNSYLHLSEWSGQFFSELWYFACVFLENKTTYYSTCLMGCQLIKYTIE